jgi:hypothetical protein
VPYETETVAGAVEILRRGPHDASRSSSNVSYATPLLSWLATALVLLAEHEAWSIPGERPRLRRALSSVHKARDLPSPPA